VSRNFPSLRGNVENSEEYSDALLGLLMATKKHDGVRCFSTFAFACMRNEVIGGYKKRKKQKPLNVIGLNEKIEKELETTPVSKEIPVETVGKFFEVHPKDTSKDLLNKKILYKRFIEKKSWKDIVEELELSGPMFAIKRAKKAIELIRKRFPVELKDLDI